MIDSTYGLEGPLQRRRFRRIAPWCELPLVDIGGNRGELGAYLGVETGPDYYCTNKVPPIAPEGSTVVLSAVLEHLPHWDVLLLPKLWPKRIVATTPDPSADPVLKLMAAIGLLEAANIAEHKQYYTKNGLCDLFDGLTMIHYERFDVFNQLVVWERR